MLPEKIVIRERQAGNLNSEIARRFLHWRENPAIETTVDLIRNELRIITFIPGLCRLDIELEATKNSLILRTLEKSGPPLAAAIPFYVPILERTMQTSFNNGVFEARLKLA